MPTAATQLWREAPRDAFKSVRRDWNRWRLPRRSPGSRDDVRRGARRRSRGALQPGLPQCGHRRVDALDRRSDALAVFGQQLEPLELQTVDEVVDAVETACIQRSRSAANVAWNA
jgi:hypothetical protein